MMVKIEDGRALRRVATTQKLVEAHAQLLREGVLAPTAAQIAEQAGVSLRTLWTVFGDMEALLKESTKHWGEKDNSLRASIDPALPLDERINQFVTERQCRLEFIAPAARAMSIRLHESEILRTYRRNWITDLSDFVEATFAPELALVENPTLLRDRIVTATTWDTWAFFTHDLGYSPDATRAQFACSVRNEILAELPDAYNR